MSRQRISATAVFLVTVWLAATPVVAQESDAAGEATVEPEVLREDGSRGQSLVIELDNGSGGGDEAAVSTAAAPYRELPDSDVEMIVGGQGKDGIAPRTRLKKED